ncbi:MAG: hypothetical protein CME61_02160 [Halobacteriovoraceae bacterium]|nr:hypothetical protein [Halobacteriovoraceae bacterium]
MVVLKWLLAFVVICVILLTASFFYAKQKVSQGLPSSAAKMVSLSARLEKGGVVNTSYLQSFGLQINPTDKKGNLPNEERLLLEESIKLNGLVPRNMCPRPLCLQLPVELKNISPSAWQVLISIEDVRFLNHYGVDPFSILRAIFVNLSKGRFAQGGSTLTQQLVKNLFLSNEKTISRKLKEAVISIYLEVSKEKESLIELYLNNVYWGSSGGIEIRGIEAASRFYFSKSSKMLNPRESLFLISMLKGPHYYNPVGGGSRLWKRGKSLGESLVRNEVLHEKDLDKLKTFFDQWVYSLKNGHGVDFLSFFQNELREKKQVNFDDYVMWLVSSSLRKKVSKETNAPFYFSVYKKERDNVSEISNLNKNGLRFQVGSTLKPIFYSLLIEEDEFDLPADLVPVELALKSGKWSPKDHIDMDNVKVITHGEALKMSLNGPLISLAQKKGFSFLESQLEEILPRLKRPLAEYPSQLLGSVELTVSELAGIYERFLERVCQDNSSRAVYDLLSDPTKTTVWKRSNELKGVRFFGKTGTSNKSFDNWFVYGSTDDVIVIWFGYVGQRNRDSFKISGASTAYEILKGYWRSSGKRIKQVHCF